MTPTPAQIVFTVEGEDVPKVANSGRWTAHAYKFYIQKKANGVFSIKGLLGETFEQ